MSHWATCDLVERATLYRDYGRWHHVASGRAGLTFNIETRGIREIERALDALPTDALVRMKARTKEIGRDLADRIKAAGRADTRQSARAAATVRFRANQSGGTVKAGPHDLLFGSEFGIRRRTENLARFLGFTVTATLPFHG